MKKISHLSVSSNRQIEDFIQKTMEYLPKKLQKTYSTQILNDILFEVNRECIIQKTENEAIEIALIKLGTPYEMSTKYYSPKVLYIHPEFYPSFKLVTSISLAIFTILLLISFSTIWLLSRSNMSMPALINTTVQFILITIACPLCIFVSFLGIFVHKSKKKPLITSSN